MLAHRQVAVELILRRDGEVDQTVTKRVTVLAITILEDADRVGQTTTALELTFKIVISLSQIMTTVTIEVVGIGRKERRLSQRQETRRGNNGAQRIGRSTIVAQVTVHITVRSVEAHAQVLGNVDV